MCHSLNKNFSLSMLCLSYRNFLIKASLVKKSTNIILLITTGPPYFYTKSSRQTKFFSFYIASDDVITFYIKQSNWWKYRYSIFAAVVLKISYSLWSETLCVFDSISRLQLSRLKNMQWTVPNLKVYPVIFITNAYREWQNYNQLIIESTWLPLSI